MTITFKIVVVCLVTLQLVQQASLSNKFYDTKDFNGPLNNKLTFHSRFNVLSSLKSKQSVKHEPQVKSKEELNHLNVERGSNSRPRSKRQLDQDADIDAEIISNDPKIFSFGKSMPMTTADDKAESSSWNDDLDTTIKNSLGGLEDENNEDGETTNEEQESEKLPSTLHSQFQDISSANHEPKPKMTNEDNLSETSSRPSETSSSEIHIVPTILYEGPVSKENDSKPFEIMSTTLTTKPELQYNNKDKEDEEIVIEEHSADKSPDVDVALSNLKPHGTNKETDTLSNVEGDRDDTNAESEPQKNEMEKDEIVKADEEIHSSEVTAVHEGVVTNEKGVEQHNKEPEEILLKEMDIDEKEGDILDKNDAVDVFMAIPVGDSGSKSSSGQLNLLEEDTTVTSEEGSGDLEDDPTGSHETNNMHTDTVTNSPDSIPLEEISSAMDKTNFNIDSDSDKTIDRIEDEDEDDKKIESPIVDPTASKVDDPRESVIAPEDDEELPTLKPPGNSSNNDDFSLTYDRKSIINPFNMDNASEMSEQFGKAIGILDSSAETTKGGDFEGSGEPTLDPNSDDEKDSLENGAMFKIDPRLLDGDTQTEDYIDTTTNKDDTLNETELTEVFAIVRHNNGLLNTAVIPVPEDVTQDSTKQEEPTESGFITGEEGRSFVHPEPEDTSSSSENGSVSPLPATGINEIGIQKGEQVVLSESESSEPELKSTGSFIVLGAIMATIVALLGYSVIKSYRQKQETSRRPPEDDIGTELKEVDSLLQASGRNGHGPANRLNDVESDRLLGPSAENDKNSMKPDDRYPIYRNGVHGEDKVADKPTNGLNIEDPNDLSEVKVNSHKPAISDNPNIIPQSANGLMSSPGSGDRNNRSPPADDRGYETKPESATIKMFIDHDSIPKTPIVIVKRGPANVEM